MTHTVRLPIEGASVLARVDFGLADDPPDVRWERVFCDDGSEFDPLEYEENEDVNLDDYKAEAVELAEDEMRDWGAE